MEKYNEADGVWRTIGGRRVFIKKGQSLSEAMIESGKFKNDARTAYRKAKEDLENFKKKKEEKESAKEKEEKTIHTQSGDYTADELKQRDEEIKQMYKDSWEGKISAKDLHDKLEEMKKDGKVSQGELSALQYDASNETRASENKINSATGKPIHKLGQTNETDEKIDLDNYKPGNYFENHEKERLEIAKDIAKELNPSLKNASEERLEKEAKRLLQYNDGEVLEKGEQPYTNQKGELERGTPYLEQWRDDLKKTSTSEKETKDNESFTQQTDMYGGTREYSKEQLDKMADNGVKPMEHSYTGGGWEGVNSDKPLSTKEQAKAITDEMKKKYPDVKVARRTELYSGGSSIHLDVMSSDKDLFVSDADIDKMNFSDLQDVTRSNNFNWWAKDNVPGYNENRGGYTIEDVRKYAKENLSQRKNSNIQSVTGNEWYLNEHGKNVMKDLNKIANSYTYDDSDGMIDYYNHGTYMWVNIGKWDKPYQVNESKTSSGNQITNSLQMKAYEKYKKEHPSSTMTYDQFRNKK